MMLINQKLNRICQCLKRTFSSPSKFVLGIETSCDDTGAAVLDENGTVLGEALSSQLKVHILNGGVIPHIAVDLHKQNIKKVVATALETSGLQMQDLSAIAVTNRPGLRGSLLIGTEYAKKLARKEEKPIIPIHHMEAHALTARLTENIPFPFLVLLASGGHCQIALVKNVSDFYLLGDSLHNSPGELLDKIARRLKLHNLRECSEKSGGHAIDFMAQEGDPYAFKFSPSMTKYRDCNFSFSGFAACATTFIEEEEIIHDVPADGIIPNVKDFCASVLHAFALHFMHRVWRAFLFCEQQNLMSVDQRCLVFSGGVACNRFIRKSLQEMCSDLNSKFYVPPPKWCTDNGVMIAWNGMEKLKMNVDMLPFTEDIKPDSNCPLGTDIRDLVQKASIKVKLPHLSKPSRKESAIN